MTQKPILLAILSSEVCPICEKWKARYVWTCPACYKPHAWTIEQKALSDTCDAHMRAADTFLNLARTHQKPVNE